MITYTFPDDFSVAALRGHTVTDGRFCRADGRIEGEPDAVMFRRQAPDGRDLVVRIAGRPALEAALDEQRAAKAATAARLAAIGWPEYQRAQSAQRQALAAYDRASKRGYPVAQAAALRAADEALAEVAARLPAAALYANAEGYSMASNYAKAAAGREAMRAIERGADPAAAIEAMDVQWSAAAAEAVAND